MGSDRTTGGANSALIERLQRRHESALAELFDEFGQLAFGLAYRILG